MTGKRTILPFRTTVRDSFIATFCRKECASLASKIVAGRWVADDVPIAAKPDFQKRRATAFE